MLHLFGPFYHLKKVVEGSVYKFLFTALNSTGTESIKYHQILGHEEIYRRCFCTIIVEIVQLSPLESQVHSQNVIVHSLYVFPTSW